MQVTAPPEQSESNDQREASTWRGKEKEEEEEERKRHLLEAWVSAQHIRLERGGLLGQRRVDMLIGGWVGLELVGSGCGANQAESLIVANQGSGTFLRSGWRMQACMG